MRMTFLSLIDGKGDILRLPENGYPDIQRLLRDIKNIGTIPGRTFAEMQLSPLDEVRIVDADTNDEY